MNSSLKKYGVLCKKDLNDYLKNPSISLSVAIPILFIFFLKMVRTQTEGNAEELSRLLLNFGTLMNISMSGVIVISTSIAEEKEKFTLRTLMLSNISSGEFLAAKITIGLLLTMVGNVLVFFLSGTSLERLGYYLPLVLLGSLSACMISALVGILSRDQMTCGAYQVPVMLLLLVPPFFGEMNSGVRAVAKITPLNPMMKLYYRGTEGQLFSPGSAGDFLILIAWILLGTVLFALVYKKKGLDN